MPTSYNLARMTTSTTGTGTATLGSAATVNGVLYLTFAQAGVPDGATVSYGIEDTNASEVGRGVYTAAGTTLTRVPSQSTNANAAINLSGAAQIFITAVALDVNTETVNAQTGTTYTVLDLDRAKLVTLSNTSAVAVTLPQAGTSSIFASGWYADVLNLNRGAVTFTPTTSTINNGAATLVLQKGQGGRIVSDGTNYQFLGGYGPQIATQVFTSSGTYTPTAGMAYCIIECVGGGGAGGGALSAASSSFSGGGGGAGSYARAVKSASQVGASQTVTIGAAGTGVNVANGGAGGDTSVGSLCIGKGGAGGQVGGGNSIGGAGGVAGTGDFTPVGAPGGNGVQANITTIIPLSGAGGSSIFGGGAAGYYSGGAANAGIAASNYGSGGSGASIVGSTTTTNGTGGNGSAGVVIVTEFLA